MCIAVLLYYSTRRLDEHLYHRRLDMPCPAPTKPNPGPRSKAYGQSLKPPMAEAELTKDGNRINGVTWCGSRQGSCYTGTLPFGTGALCYQYEGARLIATVDALEMAKLNNPHVMELMETL